MISTVRRSILVSLVLFSRPASEAAVERVTIDHAHVTALAQELAARPHRAPKEKLPRFLRDLSYDDYRRIRFIDEQSLWRSDNLPFRVQFFHPGNLFRRTVGINEFAADYSQRIPFVRNYFDYQDLPAPGRLPGSLEYAGFRLLHPLNAAENFDEVISFLGASYYRALGAGHRYGMSARGLAINFGGPGAEEFPDFVEFWLGKPDAGAEGVTLHALLDSPSATGAFTFVLLPGAVTVVDTRATLFFRRSIPVLGLAPLTSMFWFGENSPHRFGDFRPEVHDSDGLLIGVDPDTRAWRPLENPGGARVTTHPATTGFGLLQRDREYHNYEDTEARYEKRPGVWTRLAGPWPAGHVRLLEFSTRDEYADNVVAAFVPDAPPAAGTSLEVKYEQHWTSDPTAGGPPAWIRATRRTAQLDQRPDRTKFVVDFDPAGLADVPADAPVTVDVAAPEAVKVLRQHLFRNDIDGSWRLTLQLEAPAGTPPVELRARLLLDSRPLSETWITTWEP